MSAKIWLAVAFLPLLPFLAVSLVLIEGAEWVLHRWHRRCHNWCLRCVRREVFGDGSPAGRFL